MWTYESFFMYPTTLSYLHMLWVFDAMLTNSMKNDIASYFNVVQQLFVATQLLMQSFDAWP